MPRQIGELVFVVDITSFTSDGFVGTTSYRGVPLRVEFDDKNEGVSLSGEMAGRIGAKEGGTVTVMVEGEVATRARLTVASVAGKARISSASVYYAIGRDGGAVVRVRGA